MVLEQFLDRKIVVRHAPFVFVLSAIYVFVAYAVQQLYFPDQSLATVLLLTILLVPSLHHLIVVEEKMESKGVSHFWKRHRITIRCFIGAFLGMLAGFLILGAVNPDSLGYQIAQLEQEHLKPDVISKFTTTAYIPDVTTVMAVFSHNVWYLLIGFVLSIFYGAGAVFLLTYNASFFAAFIIGLFNRWAGAMQMTSIALLHMLPESTGYILTAMAGASLSRAIIHEKLTGNAFKNVLKNDIKLLLLGLLLVLIAAFIETYVTATAFHRLVY